jgi:tetratricopeptide (TPR) repeat protein
VLAGLPGLSDRQVAEIKHHKAKALKRLREFETAATLFEEVLAGPCPLPESELQLIRMASHGNPRRAAELVDRLLIAARQPNQISNSVVLAAIADLPWSAGDLVARHADTIENAIMEAAAAAAAGADQAYQTLAAVGRHWVWHSPETFRRLWEAVPRRSISGLHNDDDRFSYAETLQLAAKVFPERRAEFRTEALTAFEAIQKPSDFQSQKHGQLLVEMGRPAEAQRVLEQVAEFEGMPWLLYWLSKALLQLGELDVSRRRIDEALRLLPESQKNYRSTFLAHRYEVRRKVGDSDAVEDLKEAIATCTDRKYRGDLERKLREHEV